MPEDPESEEDSDVHCCDTCGDCFESQSALNGHQVKHSDDYRKGIENRDLSGSNNPSWEGGRVEKTCEWCGETFKVKPARADTARFCSKGCEHEWKSKNYKERNFGARLPIMTGEDNPNYEDMPTGENHPRWKDYPEVTCQICGEEFNVRPARVDTARFCSKSCMNEWMSERWKELNMGERLPVLRGEDNPRWKGGYEPYYGPNWYEQRQKALERDDQRCQICGTSESEAAYGLEVHHIKRISSYDDKRRANKLSNLVTLCRKHHRELEQLSEEEQRKKIDTAEA